MQALTDAADGALTRLKELLLDATEPVRTEPGDLLIIDNRSAVHGRSRFTARHDGQDRWLRRMFVRADARRFRPARRAAPHVIAPLDQVETELLERVSELMDAYCATGQRKGK